MQTVRKNVERMTEVVPETEYQSLHHFTTHSPWEHRPVMDQVALDADRLLGGSPDTALVIDESSLPKKGKNLSVLPVNGADDSVRLTIARPGFMPRWFMGRRQRLSTVAFTFPRSGQMTASVARQPVFQMISSSKANRNWPLILSAMPDPRAYDMPGLEWMVDTAKSHSFSKLLTTRVSSFLPMSTRISPFTLKILVHISLKNRHPKEDRLLCTRLMLPK